MADTFISDVAKFYRTGKKVQKALRVVKRPTVSGLLSIAGAIGGRRMSGEEAGSRKHPKATGQDGSRQRKAEELRKRTETNEKDQLKNRS